MSLSHSFSKDKSGKLAHVLQTTSYREAKAAMAAEQLLAALRGMLEVWPYMDCNQTRAARALIHELDDSRAGSALLSTEQDGEASLECV